MSLKAGDKLWVAEAPPGIPGAPAVIFDLTKYGVGYQDILNRYKMMGWTITPCLVAEPDKPGYMEDDYDDIVSRDNENKNDDEERQHVWDWEGGD